MNRDDLISEIKAQLLAELGNYKDQFQSLIPPETQTQLHKVKNEGEEFIKQNPWMSVALAAAIGFLVGKLLSSSGDK